MRTEPLPCRWCGFPTLMLGTRECDGCWELRRRIQNAPEIARRMLDKMAEHAAQMLLDKRLEEGE